MRRSKAAKYTMMVRYVFEAPSTREFFEYAGVLEKAWHAWSGVGDTALGYDSRLGRLTFQSMIVESEADALAVVRSASLELIEATRAGWPQIKVDTGSFYVHLDRWPRFER